VNPLYITYPLDGFLMMLMPIALGLWLHHRLGVRWRLFVAGAITFIASQVLHIPLLQVLTALFAQHVLPTPPKEWSLPFNAILLGLLAGLFEETARWITYRFFAKSARTWREGMMLGAGHGGIEAIILGVSVLAAFVSISGMTPAQIADLPSAAHAQVTAFLEAPPLLTLLGAVERFFAICLHLAMSLLVMQSFTRRNLLYLFAAILWHAGVDGIAVFAAPTWGAVTTEVIVGLTTIPAIALILLLRNEPPGASLTPSLA
jgi:uncharacterized membrane protein YhfC